MSSGFSGASTRSLDEVTREVETRMRKLGAFDELGPGQNPNKSSAPFEGSRGYASSSDDNSRNHGPLKPMAAGIDESVNPPQENLDAIDESQQRNEGGIPQDIFDEPEWSRENDPEAFSKEVDKRLSRLAAHEISKYSYAHIVKSPKGYELVIIFKGTKVYDEDGFETEQEALNFAKALSKKRGWT